MNLGWNLTPILIYKVNTHFLSATGYAFAHLSDKDPHTLIPL